MKKKLFLSPKSPRMESLRLQGQVQKCSTGFCFLPVKIIKVVGLLMKQYKIKGTDSPVAAFLC